jgi:hypothetical protein
LAAEQPEVVSELRAILSQLPEAKPPLAGKQGQKQARDKGKAKGRK